MRLPLNREWGYRAAGMKLRSGKVLESTTKERLLSLATPTTDTVSLQEIKEIVQDDDIVKELFGDEDTVDYVKITTVIQEHEKRPHCKEIESLLGDMGSVSVKTNLAHSYSWEWDRRPTPLMRVTLLGKEGGEEYAKERDLETVNNIETRFYLPCFLGEKKVTYHEMEGHPVEGVIQMKGGTHANMKPQVTRAVFTWEGNCYEYTMGLQLNSGR